MEAAGRDGTRAQIWFRAFVRLATSHCVNRHVHYFVITVMMRIIISSKHFKAEDKSLFLFFSLQVD